MMRLRHKLLIHSFRIFDQVLLLAALAVWIALIPERGSFAYIHELINEMYGWREILARACARCGLDDYFQY